MKRQRNVPRRFYKTLCNFWITIILYGSGKGRFTCSQHRRGYEQLAPERNKAIVLEAFEPLFNKRDYEAAERFW